MPQSSLEQRKGTMILLISLLMVIAVLIGGDVGYFTARNDQRAFLLSLGLVPIILLLSYVLYKKTIFPYFRQLADSNLELHIKQEELLDTKDDLFIKFLGIYDVNYAANSPRLFSDRLTDVADITARVMEADACFIFLYDKKKDELALAATNGVQVGAIGRVRISLGDGIEGWVGRKLDPLMLKDLHADARFREIPGLALGDYTSSYCLPLFVYSNDSLVGLMEVFYRKIKNFSDEEINFFTTLSGLLSTTVQNEQMQVELRKMNIELEQWINEKTEEFRASEERYRTLVENASESIFLLADNGDIVFANEQAARFSGYAKYDLLHKNLFELFIDPPTSREMVAELLQGRQAVRHAELRKADGSMVPVAISAVVLSLMGKRFFQSVVHDISSEASLEKLLKEKDLEIATLKGKLGIMK
ncbi:MAG TPA: PAS domain S-box protein [Nitrospirota bacterium]|nr:PAS domain S-box protein [Nitrospirota bacterium]